jgi:hypothetical protein
MEVNASTWIKSNPTIKAVENIPNNIKTIGILTNKNYSWWNKGDKKLQLLK